MHGCGAWVTSPIGSVGTEPLLHFYVTDDGLQSLSRLTSLTFLGLSGCLLVTDQSVLTLSNVLTGLTRLTLDLRVQNSQRACDVLTAMSRDVGAGIFAFYDTFFFFFK